MRIFAVPAAIALACCLYMPLPRAQHAYESFLLRLYDAALRLFTRKRGQTDTGPALIFYLLLLGGAFALLGAIHPLCAMVLMAPSFTGLCILPPCAKTKDELDSGKYARNIPLYESIVRDVCESLAPAWVQGIIAPLLLCSAGMPLFIGPVLGAIYTALCALSPQLPDAARITARIQHIAERVFCFFMLLCTGVVGRNPLRTKGRGAKQRLLSILGIAGDGSDTHPPMSGDIPQGIFLCAFSTVILCFTCCAVGFVLCR